MVQTIQVRPEDDGFLFNLYANIRGPELQAWGWDAVMQRTFLQMQWYAQKQSYALQYPDSEQLLLIIDELPIGRMIVCRTDQEIRLIDLSLLSEYRNRGIGTALLQQLQADARTAGIPLRLSVLKTNPARNLYTRLGFRLIGEKEIYDVMELGEPLQVKPSK